MTTRDEIRTWLARSGPKVTHVIIACDTFDYEDYPVYVSQDEDTQAVLDRLRSQAMTRVMEVYRIGDPRLPIEHQLAEYRAWHPEPPAAPQLPADDERRLRWGSPPWAE